MAYISFKPSDFFTPNVQYTGNDLARTITGTGFQPDVTIIKARDDSVVWNIFDSARGASKRLQYSYIAQSDTSGVTGWNADGFTIGTNGDANSNGQVLQTWNWKMGTTSGITPVGITPTAYSINTSCKQGVYAYTGTGSATTLAHGLGQKPSMIMVKSTGTVEQSWAWWSNYTHIDSANDYIGQTNTTAAVIQNGAFNDTYPTDTVFSLGTTNYTNTSAQGYVAYVQCDVPGYFKTGYFMGNANLDGPFCYTGFKPAYVGIKRRDGTSPWLIFDSKRNGYNTNNYFFFTTSSAAQNNNVPINLLSNGFKLVTTDGDANTNGANYFWWAIAENPLVGSDGTPGVAT